VIRAPTGPCLTATGERPIHDYLLATEHEVLAQEGSREATGLSIEQTAQAIAERSAEPMLAESNRRMDAVLAALQQMQSPPAPTVAPASAAIAAETTALLRTPNGGCRALPVNPR
jgi:hypothetical protein